MKNETINRAILILEIAAIIIFHSLKTTPPASEKIVHGFKETNPVNLQQPSHIVLTSVK